MKRSLTSLTGRKISIRIAGYLLLFVLSSFLGSPLLAQQIMTTISSGAPGDPLLGPQYVKPPR